LFRRQGLCGDAFDQERLASGVTARDKIHFETCATHDGKTQQSVRLEIETE
jgi:hypothetical protein